MGSIEEDKNSNFFEGVGFDWESYIVHRPAPTPDFYEFIYDHHRANGGKFGLAHDIGSGPGNIAQEVGKTFARVHASEPSEYHTSIAEKRLKAIDPKKYTVQQSPGENIADADKGHEPHSVDLITVAQCIPLMDTDKAIAGWAKLLKPNGTVAIWFYGRPFFAEQSQSHSQELLEKILSKAWDRVRPMKGTGFERAKITLCAQLDNIAIPAEDWKQVRRVKWNHDKPMMFLNDDDVDFEIKYDDKVGQLESEEKKIDRDFWHNDADVAWLRGFVDYALPWENKDEDKERLEPLFQELEKSMGGPGAKHKISWPIVLLMATKK